MLEFLSILLVILGKTIEFPLTHRYVCRFLESITGSSCDGAKASFVALLIILCIVMSSVYVYNRLVQEK